jgi:alanine racemase
MACTAASLNFKFSSLNAARLGLGLYGLYPDKKFVKRIKFKPAMVWKTKIIQVKNVPAGTKIGYGGTFTTKKAAQIATLPIGYWDGYPRAYSNEAEVLAGDRLCPVRGRVCMNLTMIEIPSKIKVKIGDIVTLLGSKKNTAEQLAKWSDTINYEVITRINPLIQRLKVK